MAQTDPRFYILIGDKETWDISLSRQIWGLSDKSKGKWQTTNVGENLAFYVTSPIKKIIGFGRVNGKFTSDELIWSDEQFLKKPIWKYKFNFEVIHTIDDFEKGIAIPNNIMLNTGRSVVPKTLFTSLVREADSKWKTRLHSKILK